MPDPALVERMRRDLMYRHSEEWSMETVSCAAHLIAEVVAVTGRSTKRAFREVEGVVALFDHDSVRQRVIEALHDALYATEPSS